MRKAPAAGRLYQKVEVSHSQGTGDEPARTSFRGIMASSPMSSFALGMTASAGSSFPHCAGFRRGLRY
jgi:hypothetical protein